MAARTGLRAFIRRTIDLVKAPFVYLGGQADQWVVSLFQRPTPETLKRARQAAQDGDPELWYALANEALRDTQIRTDVRKVASAVGSARITIQEPAAYRSWAAKEQLKRAAKPDPDAQRATEIRLWVEAQLMAPRIKIRQVLNKWARALITQSIGALEVRVGFDDQGNERLDRLRVVPSQRLGWDWQRGGKLVLRYETAKPVTDGAIVEELGPSVVLAQLDEDIPDPTLRGITYGLIANWILRDACKRWTARLAEKFSIPLLWGTVKREDTAGAKKLNQMLEDLGADGHGVFFEGTKLEKIETNVGGASESPSQRLYESCGREITKLVHGHELASGLGAVAGSENSSGQGERSEQRAAEGLMGLMAGELAQQWMRPAVERRFGPEDAEKFCPELTLSIEERRDLAELGLAFGRFLYADVDTIPLSFFHGTTGIPMPETLPDGTREPCMVPPKKAAEIAAVAAAASTPARAEAAAPDPAQEHVQ